MTAMLPNTNGQETPDERYDRCFRWYEICARRLGTAANQLVAARREYDDAKMWMNEAESDLDRAASAIGLDW
jgi:hypothetical protein